MPGPFPSEIVSRFRPEAAGLVEHPSKGVYTVVDEVPPPKPDWAEPLSGAQVAPAMRPTVEWVTRRRWRKKGSGAASR
jgi:hypothetical protein